MIEEKTPSLRKIGRLGFDVGTLSSSYCGGEGEIGAWTLTLMIVCLIQMIIPE